MSFIKSDKNIRKTILDKRYWIGGIILAIISTAITIGMNEGFDEISGENKKDVERDNKSDEILANQEKLLFLFEQVGIRFR